MVLVTGCEEGVVLVTGCEKGVVLVTGCEGPLQTACVWKIVLAVLQSDCYTQYTYIHCMYSNEYCRRVERRIIIIDYVSHTHFNY